MPVSPEGQLAAYLLDQWREDPNAWEKFEHLLDDLEAAPYVPEYEIYREVDGAHRTRLRSVGEPTLSETMLTVLREIADGHNYGEIAFKLDKSVSTVKTHMTRVRARLKAKTNPHAVALALGMGLFLAPSRYVAEGRFVARVSAHPNAMESRILERVAIGDTNEEIGAWLDISPETAKDYVEKLFALYGAKNRANLIALACATNTLRFVSSRHTPTDDSTSYTEAETTDP